MTSPISGNVSRQYDDATARATSISSAKTTADAGTK